jgi:hypothetical protein
MLQKQAAAAAAAAADDDDEDACSKSEAMKQKIKRIKKTTTNH